MANEDLLVTVGVDDSSLLGGFARDVQAARAFAGDLAKAATVNFVPPRVDLSAFQAQGAAAGRAMAAGISREVQEADSALEALAANVRALSQQSESLHVGGGKSTDVLALRDLIAEQRTLAAATAGADAEVAVLDQALQALGHTVSARNGELREVAQLLNTVQESAARLASTPASTPALTISTPSAAGLGAEFRAVEAALAGLTQDERAEIAARELVIGELKREIQTLGLYGRTVNATNADAVAAWRSEAAAIGAVAADINLPREAMLKLDAVVQQTEARFTRLQRAAARVTVPTVSTGAGGGGSLSNLVRDTGAFTAQGSRAANAAISIAFGLEAMAASAKGSDDKLRTVLRSVASIGPAFGTPGLIVSAAAAAGAAIADLAHQTSAAEESVKAYTKTLAEAATAASATTGAVRDLTQAQSAQRRLVLTDNLREAREEAAKLRTTLLSTTDETIANGFRDLFKSDGTSAEAFRASLRDARRDFADGRLSADQFATAIANIGNRFPELAPFARSVLDVANNLSFSEQAALRFQSALGGVAAATHIAGTPFTSGLESQIAEAKELANAERSGGVIAREAATIAQRAYNEWRAAQHGAISETLTLADALKSTDGDIRGHAEAFVRDARVLAQYTVGARAAKEATEAAKKAQREAEEDLERFLSHRLPTLHVPVVAETPTLATIVPKPIRVPLELDQVRVDDAFVDFEQHVAALQRAAAQVDLANMVGDAGAIRIATEVYGQASTAADQAATSFATAAAAISPEALAAALDAIRKANIAVGKAVPTKEVDHFTNTLRTTATAARGVLQLADAFGHVNESVRRSLDGITGLLSGLADARDTLKEIQKTKPGAGLGDLFGSASGLASIVGVVGGLASFAQGFLSLADRGPSEAELALIQATNSNTEEMARLRGELRGQGRNAPTARELLALINPPRGPDVPRTAIDLRDAERVAKALGITLALVDSAGQPLPAALAQLREAAKIASAELLKLSDSFDAQRKQAELGRRLAGEVSTPAVQTAADLGIFTALSPHFAALFQGVDAATAEGRRIIREGLKHIFQDVVGGRITLEDLGGIANVDDLFTILGVVADDLDLFDQGLTAATTALGNVPVAFKAAIDAFRFNATRPITATPTPTPITPPTTPLTPRTAPLTTAGTTAPVTVHYYAVNVEAGAVTTTEQSGDAILASVDRAVVQRARATGGVNHPAANGIVAALGRIGRA